MARSHTVMPSANCTDKFNDITQLSRVSAYRDADFIRRGMTTVEREVEREI
jgi:hypothetical protein